MTNEKSGTALCQKMFVEQDKYTREIFCCHLSTRFARQRANALLKSSCPLVGVFNDFERRETHHMPVILDTVEYRTNVMIKQLDELKTKSTRLNELNILLNMDKRENEIADGESREEVDSTREDKGLER